MTPLNAPPPVTPRDAAAMVLLRDPDDLRLYWVRRSPAVRFMAGYHAFPGGQMESGDARVEVLNCAPGSESSIRACAVREVFEETGVLIAHGVETLERARLEELRRALIAEEVGFGELLASENLALDASLLIEAPRWITPHYMPRRYDTRFFAAWLPAGQEAAIILGELAEGEWVRPREALARWRDGECLIVTPILFLLQSLADGFEFFADRLQALPAEEADRHERIEMREGFFLCALRSPTIPPATHTNCFLIGGEEMVIIDPGSPYADEQERLDRLIDTLIAEGRQMREIIITHLHPDHIGGVGHLAERYRLPVAAHRLTAEAIAGSVEVTRLIEDGELIELGGVPSWHLRALWTPGHARGHLCFHEERTGTLITGDLVVGFGTVVIAPPEGNMKAYFASLRRLLALPKLTALLPGHGPVLSAARAKIEEYIAHRLAREEAILGVLRGTARTIPEIVRAVYTDVPAAMHELAAASVLAHLEKLQDEGRVTSDGDLYLQS